MQKMAQTLLRSDIVTLAGTRPEVIKLSEFVKHFEGHCRHTYAYTGQHFSTNMKDIFFDELDSEADVDLKCNTSDVEAMALRIVDLLREAKPSLVVVYGDTNSTLAGALAAERTGTALVHIEAGLRSFDMRMPEERNRIQVDRMSDYLLCPTSLSKEYLSYEGIAGDNVSVTGNLIVDVCRKFSGFVQPGKRGLPFAGEGGVEGPYLLLTLHRAENVDDPAALRLLASKLSEIPQHRVVFPIHPRTRKNLSASNVALPANVTTIDPVGYLDFLALLKGCKMVLTDSGGLQEEAIILGKPCITLRHTTERWETILMGANRLYPLMQGNSEDFGQAIEQMLGREVTRQPYGESVTKRTAGKVKEILSHVQLKSRT